MVPRRSRDLEMNRTSSEFITVAHFKNNTARDRRLFLEMLGAEIVISPGQSVELLARPSEGREFDPDLHVRFEGRLMAAGYPTVLSDHEAPRG
jgi:hypothetical protein